MKFQFKVQLFQTEAANSVMRVFAKQFKLSEVSYRRDVDTALITEIAKRKPYYAVFRDSSFASDSAMVNFEQVFSTYSPNTIRRVL